MPAAIELSLPKLSPGIALPQGGTVEEVAAKRFKCELCPCSYKDRNGLTRHRRVKHLKKKEFPCSKCSKVFKRKDHFDVHFRTHSGERPFACQLCPKRFTQKGHLQRHIRTHGRSQPQGADGLFHCTVCDRGFTRAGNMRKHKEKQHPEIDFQDLVASLTSFCEDSA